MQTYPPQGAPPYGQPQYHTGPKTTNGKAIGSLVASILGWTFVPLVGSIVGVILGHMARKEIRADPTQEGDGLAVAGLVIGWIAIGLAILVLVIMLIILLFVGAMFWTTEG